MDNDSSSNTLRLGVIITNQFDTILLGRSLSHSNLIQFAIMFSTIALSFLLTTLFASAANALPNNEIYCLMHSKRYELGEKKITYTPDGLYCITQECENGSMTARRTQLSECEVKTCKKGEILTKRAGECCSYCESTDFCDPACPDNSNCFNRSCLCNPGFYKKKFHLRGCERMSRYYVVRLRFGYEMH